MKERHKQIRDFIVQYIKARGYPPSYQEIGEGVGLYSKQSVHENIQQMNDLGIINAVPVQPRCISVPGYEFVEVRKE
jgi:SOS-response transcriptional repressor LexA